MVSNVIKGLHLLYVDDEQMALKYFPRCIGNDVKVTSCSSAGEALSLLELNHDRIDAVIADDRMPGMWGGDLLKIVSERWPRVSRILTTAFTDVDRLIGLIAARQVHRVIIKPWDPIALRETIGAALELALLQRSIPPDERSSQAQRASPAPGEFETARPSALTHIQPDSHDALRVHEKFVMETISSTAMPNLDIELRTCTVTDCVDAALGLLGPASHDQALLVSDVHDIVYIHSNPSCIGGALAELIGNSLLATHGMPTPIVSISAAMLIDRVHITIANNATSSRTQMSSLLAGEIEFPDDPRPGVGFAMAVWVIEGCGGQVEIRSNADDRWSFVVSLPRARC